MFRSGRPTLSPSITQNSSPSNSCPKIDDPQNLGTNCTAYQKSNQEEIYGLTKSANTRQKSTLTRGKWWPEKIRPFIPKPRNDTAFDGFWAVLFIAAPTINSGHPVDGCAVDASLLHFVLCFVANGGSTVQQHCKKKATAGAVRTNGLRFVVVPNVCAFFLHTDEGLHSQYFVPCLSVSIRHASSLNAILQFNNVKRPNVLFQRVHFGHSAQPSKQLFVSSLDFFQINPQSASCPSQSWTGCGALDDRRAFAVFSG